MHSRWGVEMQRRLGSKVLWELVSFTGKFSVEFLTRVTNVVASQPDVVASQQELKANAVKCRADLRWAGSLDKKRQSGFSKFTHYEMKVLSDFDSDKLRKQANEATKASGHGRLKNADGTFIDIGAETGGLTRTILDNWVPPDFPSEDEDEPIESEAEPEGRAQSPSSESELNVRAVIKRAWEANDACEQDVKGEP